MKNFMLIALNLGIVVFIMAGIMAFANFAFGMNIGFKGAAVPADPIAGVAFLIVAAFCYGISYLFTQKG